VFSLNLVREWLRITYGLLVVEVLCPSLVVHQGEKSPMTHQSWGRKAPSALVSMLRLAPLIHRGPRQTAVIDLLDLPCSAIMAQGLSYKTASRLNSSVAGRTVIHFRACVHLRAWWTWPQDHPRAGR
jgi:hypothetical protein